MKSKARFEINDMLPIALTLLVTGIGIAYGLSVLEDTQDDIGSGYCGDNAGWWNTTSQVCQASTTNSTAITGNSAAYNGTGDAITGIAKLPNKLPLIVTVIVTAIIIGILVRYLMYR